MDANIKLVVVDNSVVLGYLLGEDLAEPYKNYFIEAINGRLKVVAPMLLLYEFFNGLKSSLLRNRILGEDVALLCDGFKRLHIELIDQSEHAEQIVNCAHDLEISAYDAAYVVLARDLEVELVTLDERLQKKVN